MFSFVLLCIIAYLCFKLYKQRRKINEQFQKAKDAQEEAIYGKKLVRINSKKVKNCKKISS